MGKYTAKRKQYVVSFSGIIRQFDAGDEVSYFNINDILGQFDSYEKAKLASDAWDKIDSLMMEPEDAMS